MSSNQSFVQVPSDLSDELQLRRFLTRVVEQIDLISGNRSESPFVLQSEETETDLTTVATNIESLGTAIEELQKDVNDNEDDIEALETNFDTVQYANTHQTLGSVYRNFNDTAWSSLEGNGQFNDLGSNISNPPYVLTGASTYNIFAWSATTTGADGIVQRVVVEDVTAGAIRVFYRAGDTFATAQSNGWQEV